MPRMKDPPKEIYRARSKKGEGVWIDCSNPVFANLAGLEVAHYILKKPERLPGFDDIIGLYKSEQPKKPVSNPKTQKRAKKTPKTDALEAPQDKSPPATIAPGLESVASEAVGVGNDTPERKPRKPKDKPQAQKDKKVKPIRGFRFA